MAFPGYQHVPINQSRCILFWAHSTLTTPLDYGLEDSLRRLNQANEYFYAGQYELARIEMEYLVTVFPTSGSDSRLGSIYFKLNNKNKAIENWRRAYALDKSNAELDAFIKAIE